MEKIEVIEDGVVLEKKNNDKTMVEKNEKSTDCSPSSCEFSGNISESEVINQRDEDEKNGTVFKSETTDSTLEGDNEDSRNKLGACMNEYKDSSCAYGKDDKKDVNKMTDEMIANKSAGNTEDNVKRDENRSNNNETVDERAKEGVVRNITEVNEHKIEGVEAPNKEAAKKTLRKTNASPDLVIGDIKNDNLGDCERSKTKNETKSVMKDKSYEEKDVENKLSDTALSTIPSLKHEYFGRIKDLNFFLTELSFLIKSLKSETIRQNVVEYVAKADKETTSRLYRLYIAHIKLTYKLRAVYNTYNNSEYFFSHISVIFRLYSRMSEEIVKFVADIFGKEQSELKDMMKCLEDAFDELKDMDIMDYLVIMVDNGSVVSVKDVDDVACNTSNSELGKEERKEDELDRAMNDADTTFLPSKVSILSEEEKRVFCELFEMFASVLSHFILVHIFFKDVRDYLVINHD